MTHAPTHLGSDNPLRRRFPLSIKDGGGSGVPAFALIALGPPTGVTMGGKRQFSVSQPASASADLIAVNGPLTLANGGAGFGTHHFPARALYDGSGISGSLAPVVPVTGQEWGPVAGHWALRPSSAGGRGFKIVGGANEANSTVEVIKVAAGSTSGAPLKIFEVTADFNTRDDFVGAVFVNDDGTYGDPFTLYNPAHNFYGKAASLVGFPATGFQGQCELRADPKGVAPDRYEILNMDGWLTSIKGQLMKVSNYPQPGSRVVIKYLGAANSATPGNPNLQYWPGWNKRPPAEKDAVNGTQYVGLYVDSDIPFDTSGIVEPAFGAGATSAWPWAGIFEIGDPEAPLPTYRIKSMRAVRMGTVYSILHKSFGASGMVQLFKDGTRTNDGSPIPAIINPWNADATVGADVRVDFSFSPPRADAFTCGA